MCVPNPIWDGGFDVVGIQLDYPTPTFPRIRLEEQQKHSNIAKEEETPRPSKKRKVQDSSTVGWHEIKGNWYEPPNIILYAHYYAL